MQRLNEPNINESIPCLSWLQGEINKVEVSQPLYEKRDGLQYLNFAKLEQCALLINPLIELQRRTSNSVTESEKQ